MQTNWDYTNLADSYLKRPDYSPAALGALLRATGVDAGDPVCDIGAGVGHLTIFLAEQGLAVTALEPNNAMRANGMKRTADLDNVRWVEAAAEETGQPDGAFALATFGSSFNVTDRPRALAETARILRPGGWFACMWNHRVLDDPIQSKIEAIVKSHVAEYQYGARRQDQTEVIAASGLFTDIQALEGDVVHEQSVEDCIRAWHSHATLERQAKERFPAVLADIERFLRGLGQSAIQVPYVTRMWIAHKA